MALEDDDELVARGAEVERRVLEVASKAARVRLLERAFRDAMAAFTPPPFGFPPKQLVLPPLSAEAKACFESTFADALRADENIRLVGDVDLAVEGRDLTVTARVVLPPAAEFLTLELLEAEAPKKAGDDQGG